jgi:hypothetical protein
LRHIVPTTRTLALSLTVALTLLLPVMAACGPKTPSGPNGGTTAARRTGPAKCPALDLSKKLRRQKTLTRRIRKMVCTLQPCFDAAEGRVKKADSTIRLSVTIDRGGRIEAIRLSVRSVPASLTACVRAKVWRWDFDIRDDPYTYGPFKIRFAP